jgi:hypothetical protein
VTKPTLPESVAATLRRLAIEADPPKPPAVYIDAAVRRELATLRESKKNGRRNIALNDAALHLGHMVGANWLNEADTEAQLIRIGIKIGLDSDETYRTVRSGLDAGKLEPSEWEAPAFERKVEWEIEKQEVREEATRRRRSGGWTEPSRFNLALAEEPEPKHLGVAGFLLAGRLVWLFGEPETGKSLLAYDAGVREVRTGFAVVHFDAEAGEVDVRRKYRALGASAPGELARLYVYDTSGVDLMSNPGWALERCREVGARLAVFDSAGVFLAAAGLDGNENAEVARFITLVLLPVARAGVCVVVLDHVTKSDPHSRYPIASIAKLALSDLGYNVSAPEPFARGRSGRLRLKCAKDRSGWIGYRTQFDVGVTASEDGRLELDGSRMTPQEAQLAGGADERGRARRPRQVGCASARSSGRRPAHRGRTGAGNWPQPSPRADAPE